MSQTVARRGAQANQQGTAQNKIADVQARIQMQRRMIEGFQTLSAATPNQDVIRQAESNIRDAKQTISYLEGSLQALQSRGAADTSQSSVAPSSSGLSTSLGSTTPDSRSTAPTSVSSAPSATSLAAGGAPGMAAGEQPPYPFDSSAAYRSGLYDGDVSHSADAGVAPGQLSRDSTSVRRNYTNLDLIKYDTPLTSAKISRRLNQLENKLQLERQYKQGFDKIAKLYQAEGDRRSRDDAESRRVESASKIVLLQQALKRYKHLDLGNIEPEAPTPAEERRAHRKPQTGTLNIGVYAAKDIVHAPAPSGTRGVRESFVVLKVEDTKRAQTHPSRTDQWNETFGLSVDNGSELEVIVFDRLAAGHPVPVGVMWIRISDIIEELRKKKFGQVGASPSLSSAMDTRTPPAQQGEWVTAEHMREQPSAQQAPASGSDAFYSTPAGQLVPNGPADDGVYTWFNVEPTGALLLRVNFVKENVRQRPYDARLGRQGALRKRREDVSVINGHTFVPRQFYQMIRCALCGDMLLNASGSQCQDCNYTCHRKCAAKVVTKCISKSHLESDRDEVKLNHRIPHRFEPFTNIGANWCCHCGYMLPLGRRNVRKCSECDITCHADCVHLVPDFCGMSMEMANQLLSNIETIERGKARSQQHTAAAPAQAAPAADPAAMAAQMPMAPTPPAMTGSEAQQPPAAKADAAAAAAVHTYAQQQPEAHEQQATQWQSGAGDVSTQFNQLQLDSRPVPPALTPGGPAEQAAPYAPAARPARPLPEPAVVQQQAPEQAYTQSVPQSAQPQQNAYAGALTQAAPAAPAPVALQPQQAEPTAAPAPALRPAQGAASTLAATAPPATSTEPYPASSGRQVMLNDFNFLAVLGKGNFGKVMLAEEKRTGRLFAIKVLKKEFIIENDEIDSTRSEKRVFLTAAREQHPFLLGLHSCFQTETRVYFVMEYVSGGDLMLHIQREQFNLRRAKFYAAEVLLALEYFHKHGIIYRDLKLDNILLTLEGHIKIADYGLCKEGMWYGNTTSTFCGTPEFMAPEILLEQRYGRAVDWWAFGILLYEMLLGQAPFRGDDEDEIFDAILEDEPLYPIQMPRESVSILQRLLTRDPARRLGAGPADAQEVKAHPFFSDINWDELLALRVQPPFCPTLKNPSDTSWFDTEFTREKPMLTPVHSVFSPQDQAEFRDFSWYVPEPALHIH